MLAKWSKRPNIPHISLSASALSLTYPSLQLTTSILAGHCGGSGSELNPTIYSSSQSSINRPCRVIPPTPSPCSPLRSHWLDLCHGRELYCIVHRAYVPLSVNIAALLLCYSLDCAEAFKGMDPLSLNNKHDRVPMLLMHSLTTPRNPVGIASDLGQVGSKPRNCHHPDYRYYHRPHPRRYFGIRQYR